GFRDDADETTGVIGHEHAANRRRLHAAQHIAHVIIGPDTGELATRHRRLARTVAAVRDGNVTYRDVAIRQHADRPAIGVADREQADAVIAHQQRGTYHRVGRRDAVRIRGHDVFDPHVTPPVEETLNHDINLRGTARRWCREFPDSNADSPCQRTEDSAQ